jgi:hypothetical protein
MYLNEPKMQIEEVDHIAVPSDFRLGGWVYILSNDCMPGIYKVGMTTNSPSARAKELSSSTGVPIPFNVEASFHCDNPAEAEASIHLALKEERVNESREFFKIEISELKNVCREFCQASADESVAELAMQYDFISFEVLDELNVSELFHDIGIATFGDKLAIAERLIRLGAVHFIDEYIYHHRSIVFINDGIYSIRNLEAQHVERELDEVVAPQEIDNGQIA